MLVVCNSLCDDRWSSRVVCWLLSVCLVALGLSFGVCLFVVRFWLGRLLFGCSLFVVRCSLFVVSWMVVCYRLCDRC